MASLCTKTTILVLSELLNLHYPATTTLKEAQFTRTVADLAVRLALRSWSRKNGLSESGTAGSSRRFCLRLKVLPAACRAGRRSDAPNSWIPREQHSGGREFRTVSTQGMAACKEPSTNATCQPERIGNRRNFGLASTLDLKLHPEECFVNCRRYSSWKNLRNVVHTGEAGSGICCQSDGRGKLKHGRRGCALWIRFDWLTRCMSVALQLCPIGNPPGSCRALRELAAR